MSCHWADTRGPSRAGGRHTETSRLTSDQIRTLNSQLVACSSIIQATSSWITEKFWSLLRIKRNVLVVMCKDNCYTHTQIQDHHTLTSRGSGASCWAPRGSFVSHYRSVIAASSLSGGYKHSHTLRLFLPSLVQDYQSPINDDGAVYSAKLYWSRGPYSRPLCKTLQTSDASFKRSED